MLCVVDPAKEMLSEAATPGGEEGAAGLQGGAGSLGQLDGSKGSVRLLVDTGMSTTGSPPPARASLVSREHSARAPNTECL